ncbi:hypothetical protein QQ045_029849 [Rhodiola kirilowii]
MRIKCYSCAFLTLLLIFAYFSATSIQESMTSQDQGKMELNQVPKEVTISDSETGTNELLNEIMGMEVCHSKDEECLARRMGAEAHLDYIYTQHHKP